MFKVLLDYWRKQREAREAREKERVRRRHLKNRNPWIDYQWTKEEIELFSRTNELLALYETRSNGIAPINGKCKLRKQQREEQKMTKFGEAMTKEEAIKTAMESGFANTSKEAAKNFVEKLEALGVIAFLPEKPKEKTLEEIISGIEICVTNPHRKALAGNMSVMGAIYFAQKLHEAGYQIVKK